MSLVAWHDLLLLPFSFVNSAANAIIQSLIFLHSTLTMTIEHAPTSKEVYLLQLTDSGAPAVPNEYIYLPPPTEAPYILRFEIEGTSSICCQGSLWINIPKPGKPFRRTGYQEHKCVGPSLACKIPTSNMNTKTTPKLQWLPQDRCASHNGWCLRILYHLYSPS